MADINSGSSGRSHEGDAYRDPIRVGAATGLEADEALVGLVELLFFAYRDFTGEADEVLQKLGYGRAHHRVLHFVNRRPGLRVADLLDILRITKQSLARVLKQLLDDGYIEQMAGMSDRRERRLYVTFKGESLARELMALQAARIGNALSSLGAGDEGVVHDFLVAMIGPDQRATISGAIATASLPQLGKDTETVAAPGSGATTHALSPTDHRRARRQR